MPTEGTPHTLKSVLEQEVLCSRQLLETLDAERSALIERDIDALETAVQNKFEFSQKLEQLDQQREGLVSAMGFASDPDSLKRCFGALPETEELLRLWQRVIENVGKCRTGNLANGGILEAGRQQIDQALCILRGQHGSPSLYNPSGETHADLGRRELGKV